jgi:spermidine synthase
MIETVNQRPPLAAVATLSAAVLAYEVLLLRLFAIVQWHHFAYLAISVALLGFGAAGTFVTLARTRLVAWFPASFASAAAAFAVAALACFAAAERVPFNALEIAWNPGEYLGLAAIYLLLFIPFFCAATALCIAYSTFGTQIPRLYGADILGAGLGSLGLLGVLFVMHPAAALRTIFALGLMAATLAAWSAARRTALLLACAACTVPWLLPTATLELVPSDYKELRQALRAKGAQVVAQRSSPLGVVTAVASPEAPPRHAPGLSLNAAAGPPEQIGLFVDGQAAGAVTRFDGDLGQLDKLAYLAEMTSALPYHLLEQPRVLVLGAGAGGDVLQALVHGARQVDAVELDGQLAALVQEDLAIFSGRPYAVPGVHLHVAEVRSFVAASRAQFDLIQVALLDAFGSSAAGLGSLAESHLYTVEAFDSYLDRLAPGGLLAITRWVALPPRDALRLFSTAVAALERRGVAAAGRSLLMARNWSTATLLVKNGAFSAREIDAVREFCRQRAFDTVYFPGIAATEANRFNVLGRDDFFSATQALLAPDRREFIDNYKFDLTPTTDDQPYFFHFFKWRTLPEFWQLRAQGALPPLDWGYPVLVLALLQATIASMLLILLPLALTGTRRAFATAPPALRRRVPVYFLALGLGFMAIEVPFLQRFTLFLGHPAIAAAVVLAAFLVCAGLGARYAARLAPGVRWPFAAIAALALLYVVVLPPLLAALMPLAVGWKILLAMLLVAPLAFCLGMPFPLGLAAVATRNEPLVPWAWGINGFASVVATLLATLLAIHHGQTLVMLFAVALYALAAWQFPQAE